MDHLSDETLDEYLDQSLDSPARTAVEAHLAGCPACTIRLEHLRSLFAQLEAPPDVALDRDLSPSVVNAIRRQSPALPAPARRAPWLAGLVFAGQAAAAGLLLLFAWPLVAGVAAQHPLPAAAPALAPIIAELGRLFSEMTAFIVNPLGLWNAVQHSLASVPVAVAGLLPAWLQPLQAGLVVGAAALIWLLGNALMLTPPIVARLRRHS